MLDDSQKTGHTLSPSSF